MAAPSSPSLLLRLNPQTPQLLLPFPLHRFSAPSPKLSPIQFFKFQTKFYSLPPSLQSPFSIQGENEFAPQDHGMGDCLVFEEGVFEDPYLENASFSSLDSDSDSRNSSFSPNNKNKNKKKKNVIQVETENLVPDKWREVQAEINISKKERRKIAQELEFNSRVEKKKKGLRPIRSLNLQEYKAFREAKLAQLKPLVLDNPSSFSSVKEKEGDDDDDENEVEKVEMSERVAPKNPRWAVYGKGFDDVNEFFNSGHYQPGVNNSEGPRKLFTKEEKMLLNKKIPDLVVATSGKWLPLHTLAASGEFYLVDTLLKHNVDINAVNVDGLTVLHKAILCKKHAVTSYLLRESANPFVLDSEGASLLHYAVQTASIPAIKLLLLYNVDVNLPDNDGWTPLHVAVQARRSDVIKLLLIKGADRTLKSKDGLTPLDLCLHSGRDTQTYELIKLMKQFAKKR